MCSHHSQVADEMSTDCVKEDMKGIVDGIVDVIVVGVFVDESLLASRHLKMKNDLHTQKEVVAKHAIYDCAGASRLHK